MDEENVEKAKEFCDEVRKLAKKYDLPFFVVTDGASATNNNGCEAVSEARKNHMKWEEENNFDPYEDWKKDTKTKLKDILEDMDEIQYGFVDGDRNIYPDSDEDWDNSFAEYYALQSPEDLLKYKYGVCWDQVELERYYLEKLNLRCETYFIVEYDSKVYPTHTFIVAYDEDNTKCYWLEHSWEKYIGIHEYANIDELLEDVKEKFEQSILDKGLTADNIRLYRYSKPEYGIKCLDFYKHCEQGKIIDL